MSVIVGPRGPWNFFFFFFSALSLTHLSACNFLPSQTAKKYSAAKLPVADPTIPVIKVPGQDDSDPGSGTPALTGEDLIYSKGVVRSLKASELPVDKARIDLSGTVAKMELRYRRTKNSDTGKYPDTLVHLRRWGPFRGTIDIGKLVADNLTKFSCPKDFTPKASREFDRFDHSGESNQKIDTYAKNYEIRDIDPTTASTRYYYPSAISEFKDTSGLPTVKMKAGFEYDGDRNQTGINETAFDYPTAYTNDARAITRNEVRLVPDTYYVYAFCVGDVPSDYDGATDTRTGSYNWRQGDIRVFRPMDLEKPVLSDDEESQIKIVNYTDGDFSPKCTVQNDKSEMFVDFYINVTIPRVNGANDSSIGRLPFGTTDAINILELHYITTTKSITTSFIEDPTNPLLGKLDDASSTSFQAVRTIPIDQEDNFTVQDAYEQLLNTGSAKFKFRTKTVNPSQNVNDAEVNTLFKDYSGGLIPLSPNNTTPTARIAYEFLIKDRSIVSSTTLLSPVFSQPLDTLAIFSDIKPIPRMSGAVFARGSSSDNSAFFFNKSGCK